MYPPFLNISLCAYRSSFILLSFPFCAAHSSGNYQSHPGNLVGHYLQSYSVQLMNTSIESIILSQAAASVAAALVHHLPSLITTVFGSNSPKLSQGDSFAAAMAIALRITDSLSPSQQVLLLPDRVISYRGLAAASARRASVFAAVA